MTIWFIGCQPETTTAKPPPRPVAWAEARAIGEATRRNLSGVVRSTESVTLAFEVPGRVEQVLVDIGDRFERGDVLARLDRRTYELQLRQKKAELAQARAQAAEAAANLRRVRAVLEERATTEAEFDRAKAAADTSASRVELLRASVELARESLGDTVLVAPYPGEVARRFVEPSQLVQPGQPALEIQAADEGLEVRVEVPETLVDRLVVGSTHTAHLPARPEDGHEVVLTNIAADSSGPNVYPATLRFTDDAPSGLRSGLTAEVELYVGEAEPSSQTKVRVPVTAIVAKADDRHAVFVVVDDDHVEERSIVVRELTESHAIIASGLRPGEVVVTKGAPFLRDGQAVVRLDAGVARFSP